MSDDLSMPWEGEEDIDQSPTYDSPVATLNDFSDDGVATYGSREDRRNERNEESTSDDVDVRKLFNNPSVDLIRWQYRQNGMASTVVDKPVKDAWKHGVELTTKGDNDGNQNLNDVESWYRETYAPLQREARIKARRDGFSLLFWVVDDTNGVEEEIQNPSGVADIRVVTLDNLARGTGNPRVDYRKLPNTASAQKAADNTEYKEEQLVVTRSGLVVVDDITSTDHHDFVGCMYERNPQIHSDDTHQFIHADRLQLFVNRPNVDGDVHDLVYGHVEGDSTLTPIIHPLAGITKAEWALGQTLLRYTAPLHVVEIDGDAQPMDGDWEEHIDQMNDNLDNVNNKSSLTLPPAHEAKTLSAEGDIDPEPFLDGLINDICAGSEITRSVLLGTQAGTVSGSSTDIKNYYNQVERYRSGEATETAREGIRRYTKYTNKSLPDYVMEWGPLFKIDDAERADSMRTVINAITQGISNYVLSLEEAREILEEEWAELDIDVALEDITEDDLDQLDRINTTKGKQYPEGRSAEEEVDNQESNRASQNGGGREESSGTNTNTTDPSDPS